MYKSMFCPVDALSETCSEIIGQVVDIYNLLERASKVSFWSMLTVLKTEIKPSTPASFHNFRTPKVVIGLISNHFHELL